MKKLMYFLTLVIIQFLMVACNLGNVLTKPEETEPAPTQAFEVAVSQTLTAIAIEPSPALQPTEAVVTSQASIELDVCTLITAADAEIILAEPANAPEYNNGICLVNNAKDRLYMVSVAAGQDKPAEDILQGQAMLMGFAGGKLDEARIAKLKELLTDRDYPGYFTELVAGFEGAPTAKAYLVEDGGSDVVYWAWITADPRRQAAYVAVRGQTVVNINLIVSDAQSEEAMLAASSALAEKIFGLLPPLFTIAVPTQAAVQLDTNPTPTFISASGEGLDDPSAVATTPPPGLPAPNLVAPADGTVFETYPRTTTLQWSAVAGASKYVLVIQACSNGNPSDCFDLKVADNVLRETYETSYTFDFVGAQPGQWRVWAVDGNGQAGLQSTWWKFSYTH